MRRVHIIFANTAASDEKVLMKSCWADKTLLQFLKQLHEQQISGMKGTLILRDDRGVLYKTAILSERIR